MIKAFAITALEKAIKAYLKLDPETMTRLAKLSGNIICFDIQDLNIQLYFKPDSHGLYILSESHTQPTTIIKGSLVGLFCAYQATDHASRAKHISIEGDMEVGQAFYTLLNSIDIDWEELLSQFTGDIIAHQAGNLARSFFSWGKATYNSLQNNLTEYLQEEISYFPPREEVADFLLAVDQVRDDVERLAAKIDLLKAQL